MAIQSKAIKKRIASVKNIKKITHAMEMVAASKMKKATNQAISTRTYAQIALEILVNIAKDQPEHALLAKRVLKNVLILVISSNKGLCGSYNFNIFKKVKELENIHKNKNLFFITVGKQIEKEILKIFGKDKHLASFVNFSENPEFEEILPLSKMIVKGFLNKKYDRVKIVYTNFISPVRQETKKRNVLPVSEKVLQEMIDSLPQPNLKNNNGKNNITNYLFEPDKAGLLEEVLPRLVEIQIYQSILESSASEHSARMMAMKNASESASEMTEELTLYLNRARQAAITQEISEIASGAAALN